MKKILSTFIFLIVVLTPTHSKCLDLSFLPQLDKMPDDIQELLKMPRYAIPDSVMYDYFIQTQNLSNCNYGLEIFFYAYATVSVGKRLYVIYELDSLYFATLYICEIIPEKIYPPNLIIATKESSQNTGFLSDNNHLSIYSVQGNKEYHTISESTIDLTLGLQHLNKRKFIEESGSYAISVIFSGKGEPVDSTLYGTLYPIQKPNIIQSRLVSRLA